MRPAFSTETVKKALLVAAAGLTMISLAGCHPTPVQTVSLGEWIREIDEKAGISSYAQNEPYFLNITKDNEFFTYVQSAVEWDVIEPDYPFDPNADLTREWAAYTLVHLMRRTADTKKDLVKDAQKSMFPDEINQAVVCGLMQTDERGMFDPKKVLSKDEADGYLAKVILQINTMDPEEEMHTDLELQDDAEIYDIPLSSLDPESMTVSSGVLPGAETGDFVRYQNSDGMEEMLQVDEISEDEIHLKEAEEDAAEDIFKNIDMSGSVDINFDECEIVSEDGEVVQEASVRGDDASDHIRTMAVLPLSKTLHVGGFKVEINASGTSVSAEVYREMPHGSKVYADVKVNGVHVDYSMKRKGFDVEYAFFKVNFASQERMGIRNGSYKKLYGDFSKIDPKNFLSTLASSFRSKSDVVQDSLTLCTIKVPIPSAPGVDLTLKMKLYIYADGRAEIAFTQNNVYGFEIRNNNIRFISDHDNSRNATVKATFKATAGLQFDLNLLSFGVMNLLAEAGVKTGVSTTVHLYDEDGKKTAVASDLPADVVDEMAEGNPDVLVCADTTGHFIFDITLNSAESLLGRLGFSKTFNVLNESNAPIIPGFSHHFENWQIVDHCTRNDRLKNGKMDELNVTKRITIGSYSMTVPINRAKPIRITGLPEEYTVSDLIFESSDPSVAGVNAEGYVYGVKSGSAVISVTTKDKRHIVHCNIIVPEADA